MIAVAVLTVRYYYDLLPVEIVMLIAGLVLVAISYFVIRLLKRPRYGYTFEPGYLPDKSLLNLEALITAESFGSASRIESGNLYGRKRRWRRRNGTVLSLDFFPLCDLERL